MAVRRLKTKANTSLVHPSGEGELDFKFLPAGGQFHLRGSVEALTAYGGLVAWDHCLERCGVFGQLAAHYPLPRPSSIYSKPFSLRNRDGHTEAIKSRHELLFILFPTADSRMNAISTIRLRKTR
ncbi:MAG: hypothetical protein Q8Q59_11955 [Luteolibacter sp.]|jgi:hypothetical protein|nr:hypothetical protein [Luteolibacter sp.]